MAVKPESSPQLQPWVKWALLATTLGGIVAGEAASRKVNRAGSVIKRIGLDAVGAFAGFEAVVQTMNAFTIGCDAEYRAWLLEKKRMIKERGYRESEFIGQEMFFEPPGRSDQITDPKFDPEQMRRFAFDPRSEADRELWVGLTPADPDTPADYSQDFEAYGGHPKPQPPEHQDLH